MVQSPSLVTSHAVDANLVPAYWDVFASKQVKFKKQDKKGNSMVTSSFGWVQKRKTRQVRAYDSRVPLDVHSRKVAWVKSYGHPILNRC